jgi:hypothetical protein
MTLQGIDFQGRITKWTRAKTLGKTYAIARCVGENGEVDPDYAANVSAAAKAGFVPGGFHFIARGTVREHCRKFIDTMGDPAGKLVMVDVETPNFHKAPRADDVAAWFDEYRSHVPDHPIIVYSRANLWAGIGNPRITDPHAVLMTSGYPGGTAYPGDKGGFWDDRYGGLAPKFWQYAGTTELGLGAGVDLSAFKGTIDDLWRLTGKERIVPAPITDETPMLVTTAENSTWFDLDGKTALSKGHPALGPRMSPYGVGQKRAIYANEPDGAHRRVVLVVPASVSPMASPECAAQVKDAVNRALDHVAAARAGLEQAIAEVRPV